MSALRALAGRMPALQLLNPIRDEDIRLALRFSVPIRGEYQLPAVGRKHRKAVKRVVVGNALERRAVSPNHVKIEIPAFWIGDVRSKDNALTVRKKVRPKARLIQMR